MSQEKSIGKHIIEAILIFFGSAVLFLVFFQLMSFSWSNALLATSFNSTTWVLMWKGNEIIVSYIDQRISWLKTPGKRLVVGILAMLLYVMLAAVFINLVFYLLIVGNQDYGLIYDSIVESTIASVIITIFIMLSIYSYSFLKAWRQAAINIEKLQKESIASQYEILKNQVNPHFLFNTLNALTTLIYEDQAKAVEFINRFSDVYRYVLDSKDKEVVPVKEETEFVRAFIYLLQTRYEKNFKASLEGEVPEGYIPPMALQLVIENAIKHNVISDENPLSVSVKLSVEKIIVTNNITQTKRSSKSSGLGLKNIRSRYGILSNKTISVIENSSTFTVILPVLQLEGMT